MAPSANQPFIPKTSRPIWSASTSSVTASTTPENSWPGIAPVLLLPSGVWEVGYHRNSVGVTPAAWTRMSISPRPGWGTAAVPAIKAGASEESLKRMTLIVFIAGLKS